MTTMKKMINFICSGRKTIVISRLVVKNKMSKNLKPISFHNKISKSLPSTSYVPGIKSVDLSKIFLTFSKNFSIVILSIMVGLRVKKLLRRN